MERIFLRCGVEVDLVQKAQSLVHSCAEESRCVDAEFRIGLDVYMHSDGACRPDCSGLYKL